jgi:AraC-like DNA-binding protein
MVVMAQRPEEHINDIVFAGDLFKVGRWRLPVTHERFHDSGPARHYLVVFPRTSTWIQHAGSAAFPSDANNVTYYNLRQEYFRRPIAAAGDFCDYYAVNQDLLRQIVGRWDPGAADQESRIIKFQRGPCDVEAYYTQRCVYRHVRREAAPDALFVEETMIGVLRRLFGMVYGSRVREAECHREIVEHTQELVTRRFCEPSTISELAAAAGVSVFHLCRVFRAHTGTTIHAYRNQLRLRTALERVLDSQKDLSDLALDLGYCSHSHFTAAFRRLYGITPSAARQRPRECQMLPNRRHSGVICAPGSRKRLIGRGRRVADANRA